MRTKAGGRPGWLCTEELAEHLKKSKSTIRRYEARGIIPIGRRFPDGKYWRPEEVDRYLKNYDVTEKQIETNLRMRVA